MANAKKKRQRDFPQADFEIEISVAVGQLMHPSEVEPGDQWSFQADGDTLRITRMRTPVEHPVDPEEPEAGPGNSPLARARRVR
jgi:hypothetical protein